jgi:hypothetical protein
MRERDARFVHANRLKMVWWCKYNDRGQLCVFENEGIDREMKGGVEGQNDKMEWS